VAVFRKVMKRSTPPSIGRVNIATRRGRNSRSRGRLERPSPSGAFQGIRILNDMGRVARAKGAGPLSEGKHRQLLLEQAPARGNRQLRPTSDGLHGLTTFGGRLGAPRCGCRKRISARSTNRGVRNKRAPAEAEAPHESSSPRFLPPPAAHARPLCHQQRQTRPRCRPQTHLSAQR
jgi:hypothetical protein